MAKTESNDYDSPWKEAVGRYFKEFLALLFPQIHDEIDWDKGLVFLDKELQKIVRDGTTGRRYVDKLAKVWTKKNREIWVLIHVEVQGEAEDLFPKRMYVYNFRIFDSYDRDVVSLGVLTDSQKSFRPDSYSKELWGCSLDFRFPIVKLMDWEDRWDELEASDNVFSLVVMAQIKAKSSKSKDELKAWKYHLVKLMYQRNYSREDILQLYRYIDWMISLPKELEAQFLKEVYLLEEEKKMPYITSAERFGLEKGVVMGRSEGVEIGTYNEKFQTIMRLSKLNLQPQDIAAGVGLTPEKVREVLAAGDKGLDLLIGEDATKH
ncbi:hypothetical protein LZ24_03298 [Desulfobotulus alkaliphilus]|uniref:Transposase/invertase (TIGR01784 family) n=1 Tax=Desulfobotulus alkaliphilus TaxID=622671 RepID=A0A562R291_9BACT|nr:hypothetical protein [Desulfobotulus alkaliphilus]TWI63157.1 hypothetical protein LZ24_03298 [Desulfobotulus alkaliphilus]